MRRIMFIALKWAAVFALLSCLGLIPILVRVSPLIFFLALATSWIGAMREIRKRSMSEVDGKPQDPRPRGRGSI